MESDELDDLTEAGEIEDGVADGLRVLTDLVEAVGVEQRVTGGRLEEEEERHGPIDPTRVLPMLPRIKTRRVSSPRALLEAREEQLRAGRDSSSGF